MELEKLKDEPFLDELKKQTKKTKLVTVRFSEEEKEKLDEITKTHKTTKTAFIRKAVIMYMNLLRDSNNTFLENSFFQKLITKLYRMKKSINNIEEKLKDTENILEDIKIPEKEINKIVQKLINNLLI